MPQYKVGVRVTAYAYTYVTVDADNEQEAEELAEEMVDGYDLDFEPDETGGIEADDVELIPQKPSLPFPD